MIPNQITIHHSDSGINTTVAQINDWHRARDFTKSSLGFYVGYHYVILGDGSLVQTRRENEMGCHSRPNDGKIGICLVGNFEISEPSQTQLNTLTKLVNSIKTQYNISMVLGHRDCNKTECPGDNLYKFVLIDKINWLQKLLNILLTKPSNHA